MFHIENKAHNRIKLNLGSITSDDCEDKDKIYLILDGAEKGPFCAAQKTRVLRDTDEFGSGKKKIQILETIF